MKCDKCQQLKKEIESLKDEIKLIERLNEQRDKMREVMKELLSKKDIEIVYE